MVKILKLLDSPIHEYRFTALMILVFRHERGDAHKRIEVCEAYLASARFVNNWDLVDSTAEHVVGPHIHEIGLNRLVTLAHSSDLWERRIAMLSCFYAIKRGSTREAFEIMDIIEYNSHDLIQKAVGWMLREIGKRQSQTILEARLKDGDHYKRLPRTTLRYAIEHFTPEERSAYLKGIA